MVTLEQIKLLESKLSRAINFVTQVTEENSRLKKRNDSLEKTIGALKEEKTRIEEGIVSALGKLNQFEDAIERSLGAASSAGSAVSASSVKSTPKPVQAVKAKPVMPSAYTVDEEENAAAPVDPVNPVNMADSEEEAEEEPDTVDTSEDFDEDDSGEAELDIF